MPKPKVRILSNRTPKIDRYPMNYVVNMPQNWRRREVMAVLRHNFLNDNMYSRETAEWAWGQFCLDFVNHWTNRQGFKAVCRKWKIKLREKNFDSPYTLGYWSGK